MEGSSRCFFLRCLWICLLDLKKAKPIVVGTSENIVALLIFVADLG